MIRKNRKQKKKLPWVKGRNEMPLSPLWNNLPSHARYRYISEETWYSVFLRGCLQIPIQIPSLPLTSFVIRNY